MNASHDGCFGALEIQEILSLAWQSDYRWKLSPRPLDCSQSPVFCKIIKIDHFALQAAILVSMSLAW